MAAVAGRPQRPAAIILRRTPSRSGQRAPRGPGGGGDGSCRGQVLTVAVRLGRARKEAPARQTEVES